ncbi:MAG: hypothetical protein J6M18_04315 [Actinomycetaceae bacterium]|nr:hypothetical protein [Actinomycetaceae bacterium]
MEWVLTIAEQHKDLQGAIITMNDEWLNVLLPDSRAFRFRPSKMIDESLSEEVRTKRLTMLLSIGVKNATHSQVKDTPPPTTENISNEHTLDFSDDSMNDEYNEGINARPILPIIRRSDYFIQSHNHETSDSIIYLPLTDFVGIGIAEDLPQVIQPIFYSHFEEAGIFERDTDNIGELFNSVTHNLRAFNLRKNKGLNIAHTTINGAHVFSITSPHEYQSSWFGDIEIIHRINEAILQDHPNQLLLYIPASRTNLFIVFADDPHLAEFFSFMRRSLPTKDSIYPLPHTIAEDGWKEWIPFLDHPAARILENIRTSYRKSTYDMQVATMNTWPQDHGMLKEYTIKHMKGERHIAVSSWEDTDIYGSIPECDYISFIRSFNDKNGIEEKTSAATVKLRVACDIWREGIQKIDNIWPPRYAIQGFPSEDILTKMREASRKHF